MLWFNNLHSLSINFKYWKLHVDILAINSFEENARELKEVSIIYLDSVAFSLQISLNVLKYFLKY